MTTSLPFSLSTSIPSDYLTGRRWDIGELLEAEIASVGESLPGKAFREFVTREIDVDYISEASIEVSPASSAENPIPRLRQRNEPFRGFNIGATKPVVYLSRDWRAYTKIGLKEDAFYGNAFRAFEVPSLEIATWLWTVINSGAYDSIFATVQEMESRFPKFDALGLLAILPDVPDSWPGKHAETASQIAAINGSVLEPIADEVAWRYEDLTENSIWELRGTPDWITQLNGQPLFEFGRECILGRAFTDTPGSKKLPVADSKWIRNGIANNYAEVEVEKVICANSGDLVVTTLGEISRSRIAKEAMVVPKGLLVLRPNSREDSELLNSFLNSEVATCQRKYKVTGLYIPHITKQALLELKVTSSVQDIPSKCRQILDSL